MKQCEYCFKKFKIEKAFVKHECKEMKRHKYVKTLEGTKAYGYFKMWVKGKKSSSYDVDHFIDSNYYKSFVRFGEYVKNRNIANLPMFIKFLIIKQLTPNTWCSDMVLTAYIEYIDTQKPMDSVVGSLQTLNKLGTSFNCSINEVLYKLRPNEYIHLIQTRHLTPWLLLNTKGFKAFLMSGNMNREQTMIVDSLIPSSVWKKKLISNPKHVIKIKEYIEKLKL